METIELPPDYPNLTRWWFHAISEHSFTIGELGPTIQFAELIRYLQAKQPEELEKILIEMRRMQHKRNDPEQIYVQYCDTYDSITKICSHTRPPRPHPRAVLEDVLVISADGTSRGDLMSDDSIRIREYERIGMKLDAGEELTEAEDRFMKESFMKEGGQSIQE